MKIKVLPEDFRVEELLQLRLTRGGHYSIYRLEKRDWNTLNLLDYIGRKYRLRRLSRAGLKDRYSLSVQYVSAEGRGPGRIAEDSFTLRHIGYSTRPVTRDLLLGNRFAIVIRDLTRDEVETAQKNLPALQADGFPNYYDEQRFGSSRPGEHGIWSATASAGASEGSRPPGLTFVAGRLVRGDLEGALRLYMATPLASDNVESRRSRELMDKCWGDWSRCLKHAKPEFAPVLNHLRRTSGIGSSSSGNPKAGESASPETNFQTLRRSDFQTSPARRTPDYEGAIRRIPRDLLELFVTSYQSFLWNETLAALLRDSHLPLHTVPYPQGELLFYTTLGLRSPALDNQHPTPETQHSTPNPRQFFEHHEIPVVSPTTVLGPERIARAIKSVLTREQLGLKDFKLPFRIEGLYFKPYTRPGIVIPRDLQLSAPEPDELHAGRQKLTVTFELPPGSFATILVRRLMLH